MRDRWLHGLALSLGALVLGHGIVFSPSALRAERPGPIIQPYPAVRVETPEPVAKEAPALLPDMTAAESQPSATLDRPVPLAPKAEKVDSEVRPTGLFRNRSNDDPIATSPPATLVAPSPLPSGPANVANPSAPSATAATPAPADVPYTWRQTPTATALPSTGGSLAPLPPVPSLVAPPGGDGCADGVCAPGCGDGWGGCGCGWGRGCCFGNRWYGSAEYLLWFVRGQSLPPLLTTGPASDNPPGAIGQPGTQVLYGGGNFNNNPYSGVRLRAGWWLDDCHSWGIDLGGFFLGAGVNRFSDSSMGTPFLSRPFFNALTGTQDIEAVATPNGLTGTFSAVNTFLLFGAEANLRRNLLCGCNWYVDGFVGWRMLGLNESLTLQEKLAVASSTNPNLPVGSTFVVTDRFGTTNLFNGGQIGAIAEYRVGRWSVDLRTSVGVGGTMQHVAIDGSTLSQGPGIAPMSSTGGLLAQSSNIGSYSRGIVSFVEEVGVNVGYQFTNHIRGFVGYNFLYWNNVVRPGNQIDQTVNTNLIPPSVPGGPQRPAFAFNSTDIWIQGITFGLNIRW